MSDRIRRHASSLKRLPRSSKKNREKILDEGGRELLDCISECCLNVIKGNVPLTERQFQLLRRRKKNLAAVARKKTSQKEKRQIIQSGGFLGVLLKPILGILGSLFLGNGAR